jgi:alkanesulfonate monooxygenase SsuD/methylene tetrahydromethanopterin reductase-like flavin-dependent oxidoreductase (luciferase family)
MSDRLVKMYFDLYREAAGKFGYTASPGQLGHLMPIYVAETDERAREEAKAHLLWLFHKGLRMPLEYLFPPGYTTHASMKRILEFSSELDWPSLGFEELIDKGYAIVGSPKTVRDRLLHYGRELRFGVVLALLQFGDMPHHRTVKNMELFATEVMPHLRAELPDEAPSPKRAA